MVDEDQRDETALFGDGHVDERMRGDRLQRVGCGAGARVQVRVGHGDRLAALQILNIRSVIAKLQRAGETCHPRRTPVTVDQDRFARAVDQAITGTADLQRAAEDFGRGISEIRRVAGMAPRVVQRDDRTQPALDPFSGIDIETDAGKPRRRAVVGIVAAALRHHPVRSPLMADKAIFTFECSAGADCGIDLFLDARNVVGMDPTKEVGDRRARPRDLRIDAVEPGEISVRSHDVRCDIPVPGSDARQMRHGIDRVAARSFVVHAVTYTP